MKKFLLTCAFAAATASAVMAAPPDQPIYDAPNGVKTIYSRTSKGINPYTSSTFLPYDDFGSVVEKIVTPSGKVFLSNPLPVLNCHSYLMADETADGDIVIKLPQSVYEQDGLVFTLSVLEPIDASIYQYKPAEDQTYTLKKQGNGYVSANKEIILSLTRMDDTSKPLAFNWYGYSVYDMDLKLFEREPIAAPANAAEAKDWGVISEYTGYPVKFVQDGTDLYFKGLCPLFPDGWSKATVNGDKISFAGPQYMGIDNEEQHFVFLNPSKFTKINNVDGTFKTAYTFVNNISLNYDVANNKITPPADSDVAFYICSTSGGNQTFTYNALRNPRFQLQDRDINTPPAPPVFWRVDAYDAEDGLGALRFYQPNYDIKDNIIKSANLFYQVLVDGEPYEFMPDELQGLSKPTIDFPYGKNIGWDIQFRNDITMGDYTRLFYRFEGAETIGLRSVFIDGDTRVESAAITHDFSGIDSVAADGAQPVSTQWYDLAGRRVDAPAAGIYIRVTTLSDGTRRSEKIAVR